MESVDIGLCRIDLAGMGSVRARLTYMREKNISGYVVTPNINHLARLAKGPDSDGLRPLYRGAALSVCDSRILELILKWNGVQIPEVVTGSDLTAQLFASDLTEKDVVYILGGSDDLIRKIVHRYPGLSIKHHNPSMGFIKDSSEVDKIVARIIDVNPNYVFLAVGSPQQEILAKKICEQRDFKGIALCIGASILFMAGLEKRAPKWMRRGRLEWLYRLSQNPSRLVMRYLKNAIALPAINREVRVSLKSDAKVQVNRARGESNAK